MGGDLENAVHAAVRVLNAFCKDKGCELSNKEKTQVRRAWSFRNTVLIERDHYQIKLLSPSKLRDDVARITFKGIFVSKETKELNDSIYAATNGRWH